MDDNSQPFTQAVETNSSSSLPLQQDYQTQPQAPIPALPKLTAETIIIDDDIPLPAPATNPSPPIAVVENSVVENSSASMQFDSTDPIPILPISQFQLRPEDIPLTGIQAVHDRMAVRADAPAYTPEMSEYEPPPITSTTPATGIAKISAPKRIVTEEEKLRMTAEELDALTADSDWLSEDQVAKFDVAKLKRMGLGRTATGFCYSSRMTQHAQLPSTLASGDDHHPESPARIQGIFNRFRDAGLLDRMQRVAVREVTRDEVLLVHSEKLWAQVRGTAFQSIEYLTLAHNYFERLSLYVCPETAISARLSCGGVIEMCRAVAEGQIRNGFAIVRPPGHHAEPQDAMGFCFFNNVAVAAKWLTTIYDATGEGPTGDPNNKISKVLIIDWDVHHGNGTQKAFWHDPNILYISIHRHDGEFYPGGNYGAADQVGELAGEGFNVNVPFPDEGMTDSDYIYAFQQIILPIAYEFSPDMVLVSAGFDAAEGDNLGKMKVSPAGFAHLTHMLSILANGKLILALEGGYDVNAIAKSALACTKVLIGDEPDRLQLHEASPSATNTINHVRSIQSKYWKTLGTYVEPHEALKQGGKLMPISEILKAHRAYDLWHDYKLFNVEFLDEILEANFANQLFCSSDVYETETLLVFMHDIGAIKANYTAATLDVNLAKTQLLSTSHLILDWALKENKFGVVDVNFLAHLQTERGAGASDSPRSLELEKRLSFFIWDKLVELSTAQNIILFGSGIGCQAVMHIVRERPAVRERVRAVIEVLGMEPVPTIGTETNMRTWFLKHSLVMIPASHPLHDDPKKMLKPHRKFGNVLRNARPDGEARPAHLLHASLPHIKKFVKEKLPPQTGNIRSNGKPHLVDAAADESMPSSAALNHATGGEIVMGEENR